MSEITNDKSVCLGMLYNQWNNTADQPIQLLYILCKNCIFLSARGVF